MEYRAEGTCFAAKFMFDIAEINCEEGGEEYYDSLDDPARIARGMFHGCLLALMFWILVALVVLSIIMFI